MDKLKYKHRQDHARCPFCGQWQARHGWYQPGRTATCQFCRFKGLTPIPLTELFHAKRLKRWKQ